jgi:hypothetical protein
MKTAAVAREDSRRRIALGAGTLVALANVQACTRVKARGAGPLGLRPPDAPRRLPDVLDAAVNWFLNRDFDITRDFNGAAGTWRSISAFDLIILTISTALVLFHVWRLQDSEAVVSHTGIEHV